MKNASLIKPAILGFVFILCGVFALKEYLWMQAAQVCLEERAGKLAEAKELLALNPSAFGGATANNESRQLKALVQQAGARHGVPIVYLTESEREAGDGVKERNVSWRAVNVPQERLVKFLAELESNGGGARIKEIRLKPSMEKSDLFQEAESVLALRWVAPKPAKKENAP